MLTNLIEELKVLAENILKSEDTNDVLKNLDRVRVLYERLLVLKHLEEEENQKTAEEAAIQEAVQEQELSIIESEEEGALQPEESTDQEVEEQEQPVLSLNDLFVPTFDGIKEDMSQKDEFKDTISLDDTENLFQIKKEEPRQLSLNDKLVGSSIQVGLNDRIAFVNKLFNFSQSDFNKVLTRLNECNSKEEALKYFEYQVKPNYNWKGREDLEERFVDLIQRKFI